MSTQRVSWPVRLGDLSVTMSGVLHWAREQQLVLAEFLPGPVGRHELGHLRLDVHHDDDRVHQLIATAATRPDARRIETIPGVTTIEVSDGPRARVLTVAEDRFEGTHGTHAVRVTGDQIELLIHSASRRQHRLPLRLLREAMIRTYENAGATLLHAAGVAVRGVGIALCGPRASGKTTTLAAILAATGGDLLSNDRLLLPPADDDGQALVAVPLPVPLARGTIDAVDTIRAALSTSRRAGPPVESLPPVFGSAIKADLTAREFATSMGGGVTPGARLALLAAPRFTDDSAPFCTRSLSRAEARDVLTACCFTPYDEFWLVPWLIPHQHGADELTARSWRHLDDVAAATPAIEIRFGVRNPFTDLVDGLRRALAEQP